MATYYASFSFLFVCLFFASLFPLPSSLFTFKAIHGSAPTYISQLIRLKPKSTYMLRSNTKHFLLDQPRKMKKTTGDRAFLAAAPTLWNALPGDLRTLDNLKNFKSQLKTHFFKLAYNLCS